MKRKLSWLAAFASLVAVPVSNQAVVITFTGGTVYRLDATTETSDDSTSWDNVDYYEEGGFRLDFVSNTTAFSTHVGNYYGAGNAVIHAHWETGDYGEVTLITATKIGGGTFDLNYFILTSNTDFGGSTASGLEEAYIKNDGGNDIKLPSEDWGFPATQIFLPPSYDGITEFSFYVKNKVDCFGMDEFYIDEEPPPPPPVPDAGSAALLLGLGATALAGLKRRLS